ncbi:Rv3235 family protein [uncultured Propionibacterium sp.]|uniref:Rv3235 family protein n=1 Tax=uncultured Propionibacterium sp. TaxID=218066 RepID=UPI00292FD6B4|nr:Rv3235 family protein [uncultured Propionibacterium sp.]
MAAPTPTADDHCTVRRSDEGALSISEFSPRPRTDPCADPSARASAEAASRFALALAEVLAGQRPAAQLLPLSCSRTITELIRIQAERPFVGARLHSMHIGNSASVDSAEIVACYEWRPGEGRGTRLVCAAFMMTRTEGGWACRELTIGVPNLGYPDEH